MGCGTSSQQGGQAVPAEAKQKNKQIDSDLKKRQKDFNSEIKLLLLGAGESGKSTIFKQMKIIHHNGYNRDELAAFKEIIYQNTIQSMKVLVQAGIKLNTPIEDPENRERAARISAIDIDIYANLSKAMTPELGHDIARLWADKGIRTTYARKAEYQINDSAEYYFQNIGKISQPDYCPTEQDVLRSRQKTSGIVETDFEYKDLRFKLLDVGGQRNERKKWIHCFEGVTAVIFVTSLSEYDQKCYEDETTNRMKESLLLFDEICNSRWFANTSIILFLNKVDLFRDKIATTDLSTCFPEYTGGLNYEVAAQYIADKFLELNRSDRTQIYTHFTTATDTNNIKNVFDSVKDIILQKNLRESGLM